MAFLGSALFFVISIFFFSFLAWDYPLLSPDEPRYAETAREMLESGNYIIPYLDGIPRLVKPVLFYWLDALSLKIFGINEFAARFPSIVAASGVVGLAFLFGALNGIGILTAIVTMTSLGIFVASKLAITDMLLTFFIAAALVFFYLGFDQTNYRKKGEAYQDHNFSIWIILSIIMMGFGFLTKGPIAFVLTGTIIICFLFFKADLFSFLKTFILEISIGCVLAFLINLPWYVLVHINTNGEFTNQFFFSDNISRFLKPHTAHGEPFWFYIPIIFGGLFPWSFFLIQSIFAQDFSSGLNLKSEKGRQEKAAFFCGIWALVVLVFFSISKTKLPTYILPIFLPLCFFIARWWEQRFNITRSQNSRNLGLFWGLMIFAVTIAFGFLVYIFKFKEALSVVEPNAFLLATILICSIFFACTAIALTSVFSNAKISFIFFTGANIVCLLLFISMVIKPFATYRDGGSKDFAKSLNPKDELRTLIEHPSRFSFYRKKITSKIKPKQVKSFFDKHPQAYLAIRTKDVTRLAKRSEKDGFSYRELDSNRIYSFVQANDDKN